MARPLSKYIAVSGGLHLWQGLFAHSVCANFGLNGRSEGRFLATGPDFGPKIRFLLEDPGFRQWLVCSPREGG